MQILQTIKLIPKRTLAFINKSITKIEEFHKTAATVDRVLVKDFILKRYQYLSQKGQVVSTWVKGHTQAQIKAQPNFSFGLYLVLWVLGHVLANQYLEYKIRQFKGRGILEANLYKLAGQNKPIFIDYLTKNFFKNDKFMSEIAMDLSMLPNNKNINQMLVKALSELITTEFIKQNASELSIMAIKSQVLDSFAEKSLAKAVVILLNNPYIRRMLSQIIIEYLRGQDFQVLITDQLANILETAYTKQLVAQLIQVAFSNLLKDPHSVKMFVAYVKDYLY